MVGGRTGDTDGLNDPNEGVNLVGPSCLSGYLSSSLMGGGLGNPFDPKGWFSIG